ncbi:Armadillo Repeat-Containing X-Linked Protein 1 [Manis pentadactyla]|nr:Armadillo Repeat-Containing X-Linked Protein 1 [Manis pentadactyla]
MAKHRALDSSGSGGGRVVADRGTGGAPQQDFQELLSGFPDRTAASAGPPFQGAADAVQRPQGFHQPSSPWPMRTGLRPLPHGSQRAFSYPESGWLPSALPSRKPFLVLTVPLSFSFPWPQFPRYRKGRLARKNASPPDMDCVLGESS